MEVSFEEAKYSQYLDEMKQYFQKNNKIRDFQAHESKARRMIDGPQWVQIDRNFRFVWLCRHTLWDGAVTVAN